MSIIERVEKLIKLQNEYHVLHNRDFLTAIFRH
jgi:hypothetical protein